MKIRHAILKHIGSCHAAGMSSRKYIALYFSNIRQLLHFLPAAYTERKYFKSFTEYISGN
jgi:hypothetical protein